MAQFDALLTILELHIIKKTTSFCELSVQGSVYSALCCETKWMNLTITSLDFGIHLYGGSELSKHLSNGAFPLHGTVRFGTARYGTVRLSSGRFAFPLQFSTAIEWAGLFTRRYNCAASTAVTSS